MEHRKDTKIRLTDEIYRMVKSDSERLGMTINSYIVHLILKEHENVKFEI